MSRATSKSVKKAAARSGKASAPKQRSARKPEGPDAAAILARGSASMDEALALFDALPPVSDLSFMYGRWKGSGLNTSHAMDGLLENYAWYGKEFLDPDHVHPLIFSDGGGKLFKVNPALMPMGLALNFPVLKRGFMRSVFRLGRPILSTRKTGARLRLISHRGKLSATMAYDALPIHDVFRKIDKDTLLGLMDYKGMEQPFFFVLRRDSVS